MTNSSYRQHTTQSRLLIVLCPYQRPAAPKQIHNQCSLRNKSTHKLLQSSLTTQLTPYQSPPIKHPPATVTHFPHYQNQSPKFKTAKNQRQHNSPSKQQSQTHRNLSPRPPSSPSSTNHPYIVKTIRREKWWKRERFYTPKLSSNQNSNPIQQYQPHLPPKRKIYLTILIPQKWVNGQFQVPSRNMETSTTIVIDIQ